MSGLNYETSVSVLRGKIRQPHTQQDLGEQHLQSTVNMGNEQSGLFPLGFYSRGNEKKTRDDKSPGNKKVPVDAPQHNKCKC